MLLELTLPINIVNEKQHSICEISAAIKDLSSIAVMIPNTSQINLLIWPMKTSTSWRMKVVQCQFNHVVTFITADIPAVISLLAQLNLFLAPGRQLLTW